MALPIPRTSYVAAVINDIPVGKEPNRQKLVFQAVE